MPNKIKTPGEPGAVNQSTSGTMAWPIYMASCRSRSAAAAWHWHLTRAGLSAPNRPSRLARNPGVRSMIPASPRSSRAGVPPRLRWAAPPPGAPPGAGRGGLC